MGRVEYGRTQKKKKRKSPGVRKTHTGVFVCGSRKRERPVLFGSRGTVPSPCEMFDDEKGGEEEKEGEGNRKPLNPDQAENAGQQEGDKGNRSDRDGIGQLCFHMVEVIASCTGRGHDGGIRDRGAVVSADRTGKAGGNADKEQRAVDKDGNHDGDEDTEGPPGSTGSEGKQTGDEKDNGG